MFQRKFLVLCVYVLAVLSLLAACAGSPRKYAPKDTAPEASAHIPMPRADPAYVQYLERQSMLFKSSEMAKVVSGSELAWRASASSGTPDGLLRHADAWILFHPLTMLTSTRNPAFTQLASSGTWPVLREWGIKGIYVAPVQGSGAVWAKDRTSVDTGDDVVQYDFSRAAGDDGQYRRLMSSAIDNQGLLGSDLIPAATGLGPDFFLAARNVREYPGIYCMVEIPEKLWSHLPGTASEWNGVALTQSQVDALNAQGLLPKSMRDEMSPLGRTGGWAATGAIRGVDGNQYRWVYRYYQSPEYAVLNWEDPSQTAHRILSGSAVRQVGMQGQALLGLRFEAFQGLEAAPESVVKGGKSFSVEPARTASVAMSREVRRYGGWSWVRDDDLPLTAVRDFLAAGVDFIFDSVFSPGAEHALLTGDASLARFMADEALRLGIDARRLVHVMPAQDGINYSLPYLSYLAEGAGGERAASFRSSIQAAMRAKASRMNPVPVQDNFLYTTAAGLAAMGMNISSPGEAQARELEKGHSLLIFFKAMQPGLLMLAGQDLSGVLPLDAASMTGAASRGVSSASRGSYGITAATNSLVVSTQGMPRAAQLYPPPDMQAHMHDSFLHRVGLFLKQRAQYGVARGTLVSRPNTRGEGSIALLTRLADNAGWLLAVCNFSRSAVTENVVVNEVPGAAMARVTTLGTGGSQRIDGKTVSVTLGPWEGRAFLFGAGGAKARSDADQADGAVTPIPEAADVPPPSRAQDAARFEDRARQAADTPPAPEPAPIAIPSQFHSPAAPAPVQTARPVAAQPAPVPVSPAPAQPAPAPARGYAPVPVQPAPAPSPAPSVDRNGSIDDVLYAPGP